MSTHPPAGQAGPTGQAGGARRAGRAGAAAPAPVRVVLVDDHRMFRTGVRAELTEAMTAGGVPACDFVGEAPDVDTAVAVIRAERPDVVLLQEVWGSDPPDRAVDETGIVDQAEWLGERLGMHVRSAASPWFDGHTFTNAVLSRWPLDDIASVALPRLDGTPGHRRALAVTAATPWGAWPFVSTHLDHRFDASAARQRQARRLLELVAEVRGDPERDLPPVVGGDLNAVPDSDEIRLLTGRSDGVPGVVLSDVWEQVGDGRGHTWRRSNPYLIDSAWPDRRLDYLLVAWPRPKPVGNPTAAWLAGEAPVEIAGVQGVDGIDGVDGVDHGHGERVWASDHAAVVADLVTPDDR